MFKRSWWVFLVMAVIGPVFGFMIAAIITYAVPNIRAALKTSVAPKTYESEAVIEVRPRASGMSPLGNDMSELSRSGPMTPQFFGTECMKIKCRNSFEKVVDQLELVSRWGVDKEAVLRILKEIVTARNIPGTDLISIKVRHPNKLDARDVAEEVTKAYRDYRREIEDRDGDRALVELNKAVRDQEDKVEDRRKVLATIVRTKGIIYRGADSFYGPSGGNDDLGAQDALISYQKLLHEKMQLEAQINCFLKYDSDQLMIYAIGLDLPDNIIKNLYPQYKEATRELESLKINGKDDKDPKVLAATARINAMKRQLDEGVVNLRETLKAKLDLAEERLKNAESMKGSSREDAIKRGLDAQDYVDAKRDFEMDQQLLQQMKIKQIGETISRRMPSDTVIVHDPPVIAEFPVSADPLVLSDLSVTPDLTRNLTLGALCGLLLSPFLALPLAWLLNRRN